MAQNKKKTNNYFYLITLLHHHSLYLTLECDPSTIWMSEIYQSQVEPVNDEYLFAVEGVGMSCVMIFFFFPVTVESTGILPPDVLVTEAIQVLMAKCQTLLSEMNSTDVE